MEKKDHDKWKLLLKQVKFFRVFNDGDIDDLLKVCEIGRHLSHKYIIEQNQKDYAFYVILKGRASIIKGDPLIGKHQISTLAEGDCFGEMALLLKEPRYAGVMSVGDVYTLKIAANHIDELKLETREKLYRVFAVNLAHKLKLASDKIAD